MLLLIRFPLNPNYVPPSLPFNSTDDYRSHTTCTMTEVGNLVANRGNHGNKKKLSPQEAWMDLLHSSVEAAPPAIKPHLEQMVTLDNIPRKEKQFRNFASNSLNLRGGAEGQKTLDTIWGYLNKQRETLKKQREEAEKKEKEQKEEQRQRQQSAKEKKESRDSSSQSQNDKDEATPAAAASSASISDNSDTDNKAISKNDKDDKTIYKNVKKATKKMLKKAPGLSMKYKSLQKALREKVGVDKKKLQEVMDQVIAKESKKFMLKGKQIRLVVS